MRGSCVFEISEVKTEINNQDKDYTHDLKIINDELRYLRSKTEVRQKKC